VRVKPVEFVHQAFNDPRLRRALLKLRLPLGLAAAAWLVASIRREWFWPGLAVSALGAALQWWCFSCIRTQKELAVNGPYKAVRNPMYLARFILVFGCLLMTGSIRVLAVFTALYYFYMVNRVKREEAKLAGVFGAPYEEYRRRVHRFIPFRGTSPEGRYRFFSRASFLRNHGSGNALAVAAFYAVCWVVTFVLRH